MNDILLTKFKYNPKDQESKRRQSLRNAYIFYGFEGLKKKLESLNITSEIKSNDIEFLKNEERKISEV